MVVDSSALIAILLGEPEAEALAGVLARSTDTAMTAATWLETALVITSRIGARGKGVLAELKERAAIQVVAVD